MAHMLGKKFTKALDKYEAVRGEGGRRIVRIPKLSRFFCV